MRKGWKNLTIREETHDKVRFLSDVLGKKYSTFVSELIDELFECASDLKPNGTGYIMLTGARGKLIVNIFGRSHLISGSFTMPTTASDAECDKLVTQKINEAVEADKNE
jgi:hypothetical protein